MSWGAGTAGGFVTPWTQQAGEQWNQYNLARRPRDWRADFTREGWLWKLLGLLPTVFLPATDIYYWKDTMHREVHPLLQYRLHHPPVHLDLRGPPTPMLFPTLDRPHNSIDLAQLAFQPSATSMRLFHPSLPWYVDIVATHPNGIMISDVLEALSAQLQTQIQAKHFWNTALGELERAKITRSFEVRCRNHPELVPLGALRVDFLGADCLFEGLVRRGKGIWEIKTRPV